LDATEATLGDGVGLHVREEEEEVGTNTGGTLHRQDKKW